MAMPFFTPMAERGFLSLRGTGGWTYFQGLGLAAAASDPSDLRSG
jgi:hypothetical protein